MQQRKSVFGRPYGTDGSDFSYRMVVDPRYTKVAQGKSRLQKLIITQAVIQLIGLLCTLLIPSKEDDSNRLVILSIIVCFISLVMGELGRRRSQSTFLVLYMVASSVAALLSIAFFTRTRILLEIIQGRRGWAMEMFDLIEVGYVMLDVLVQNIAFATTFSLLRNMSPPKRAS